MVAEICEKIMDIHDGFITADTEAPGAAFKIKNKDVL